MINHVFEHSIHSPIGNQSTPDRLPCRNKPAETPVKCRGLGRRKIFRLASPKKGANSSCPHPLRSGIFIAMARSLLRNIMSSLRHQLASKGSESLIEVGFSAFACSTHGCD